MSKRTAKFVSALVVTILAGANLTAVAEDGTKTADADNCLSAPKGTTPAGSHWYYRIDHVSKRQCWYLRAQSGKAVRTASARQDSSVSPKADPPQSSADMTQSVADARAELNSPQAIVPQPSGSVFDNGQRASATDASAESSLVSTRWPDASGTTSSGNVKVATADPAYSAQTEPQPVASPSAPAVAPAAASPAAEKSSNSTQMLFIVMAGALVVAGLIGAALFRFKRTRKPPYDIDDEWRAPWDRHHAERAVPPMSASGGPPMRAAQPSMSRHTDQAQEEPTFDEAQRQLRELLAKLAKSPA
jgi:hypothetical protein